MRHGLVAFLLVVSVTSPGIGLGAEPSKPTEDQAGAVKLADEALEKLKKDGVTGFLDAAFSDRKTSLKQSDRAQGESVFGKLHTAAILRYGKPTGEIDLIRTDAIGRSLMRFVYLEKLERGALLWYMTFYRGEGDEWRWHGFNMGDQFATEFRPTKAATDKDVTALAQQGADALKTPGTEKLFEAALGDGKTLLGGDRLRAEATFASVRSAVTLREGKSLGELELVRTEALGDAFVRFNYLEKCERGAVVWKFTFYHTADGWKWQNLDVGDFGNEFAAQK